MKNSIPIWFFIGALLATYGLLILGEGIYQIFVPPANEIALANFHLAVWWGCGMLGLGSFYLVRFWPGRR